MNGFPSGEAPAFTKQKTAGAAAQAEERPSSTAASHGPLPDPKRSSSLETGEEQGSRSAPQAPSLAAPHQAGLLTKQASQSMDSSRQNGSSLGNGHNAAAWVTHATEGSSEKQVAMFHPCISRRWITRECDVVPLAHARIMGAGNSFQKATHAAHSDQSPLTVVHWPYIAGS